MPNDLGETTNDWSNSHLEYPYEQYTLTATYSRNMGLLQGPVAGPDPTCSVLIAVHAPVMQLTLAWMGKRAGYPPEVPEPFPISQSSTVRLLDAQVSPAAPALDADGLTRHWIVSGVYRYAFKCARPHTDGYPAGGYPFDKRSGSFNVVGVANFKRTIFDLIS